MPQGLVRYAELLGLIKQRIRQGQTRAVFSANAELISMYWDIGRMIHGRQQREGWGTAVIPRLSRDIRNELSEVKGFSERNIKRMLAFYREYSTVVEFMPQPVAQITSNSKVPRAVAQMSADMLRSIPWGHHALLMEKVKKLPERLWYMQATLEQGWSRPVLFHMIEGRAHERQGKAIHNFEGLLPSPQSDMAQQALKDPYVFDFLTL